MKNFNQFLYEFNRKDIALLKSSEMANYFTIAYEFEIECKDEKALDKDVEEFDIDGLDEVKEDVIASFNIDEDEDEEIMEFIDGILMSIEEEIDNVEKAINNNCNPSNYPDGELDGINMQEVVNFIKTQIISFYRTENIKYLKGKVKEHLPNFHKKWNTKLDYVLDMTLDLGIEFKPKTYVMGIDKAFELLDDFFADFDKQSYWMFTSKTGLHVNIGVNKRNKIEWNPLKGLVMLSET